MLVSVSRTVHRAGDRALLIEVADLAEVLGLAAAIRAAELPGVVEVIPAAQTVLITLEHEDLTSSLARRIAALGARPGGETDGRHHTIGVRYDGADLAEVAAHLGIEPAEVVARHTGAEYTVAFGGFAPGFAYLADERAQLDVPRRASPRKRIPAGAVGLAGRFSGVYPRESPGGWQLIGTTDAPLWDASRDPGALLQPGDRVRFVDLDAEPEAASGDVVGPEQDREPKATETPEPSTERPERSPLLRIIEPGVRALIEDGGRPAAARLGLPPSGALDQRALRTANRLVGNPPHAPALEITLGSARIEALGEATVAVAGAPVPIDVTRADGREVSIADMRAVALSPGDVLALGIPEQGLRSVIAVRGGVAAQALAGSCSADTLSDVGPQPLAADDEIATAHLPVAATDHPQPWPVMPGAELTVPVVLGPRADWFTDEAVARLTDQAWTVTDAADRVGIRLRGAVGLDRADSRELPSEGMVTGAVQVPPDGQPILFLRDHPVTGGYPVIGVVPAAALDELAQVRPGATLRFVAVDPPGQSLS